MKIVFLCTSLAPGRDGVGDYVRQLASACGAAGHACLLVALHDRHLSTRSVLTQTGNEVRFSSTLSWPRRGEMLRDLLREFDPHWISWQIVPYGFHAKGIIPSGAFSLISAAQNRPNHVMLHELWLGLAQSESWRRRFVGAIQRRRLLAFLRALRPSGLHTTNEAYQLALARQGWLAELLPLFGNIPVVPVQPSNARAALAGVGGADFPVLAGITGVIFGTVHPQWEPRLMWQWLRQAAIYAGRKITLVFVGRAGAFGGKLIAELPRTAPELNVISLGQQPPEVISPVLQAADFGIATHPWALLEKSGTTVSLLEHGLPVLVPRDDWHPRDGCLTSQRDPLLQKLRELPPTEFATWLRLRRSPCAQLSLVAETFLSQLSGPSVRGALVA